MSKYNEKLIYDYIFGNDIENYDIEELENDYDFMTEVISRSNDKNMYNLCSYELKNDYNFVKFIIEKFKDDIEFICNIADSYLEITKDELELIELNIIMKNLTKNCDEFIKLKYNVYVVSFYNTLVVDLEVYKRKEKWIGEGFLIAFELYNSSKIILDFLAEKFITSFIFSDRINIEELMHKRFKTYNEFLQYGKNNFLIETINCYDSILASYLQTNVKILEVLDEKIKLIKKEWNVYFETKEADIYYTIIDKVYDYMSEHDLECNYSASEILYFVAHELNIIDKLEKYDTVCDGCYEFMEEYTYEYNEQDNYSLVEDIIYSDEEYEIEEIDRDIRKENFNFKELKHYRNIKKMVKDILKNKYDEYESNNDCKKKVMGKIVNFHKKANN